MRKNKKVFVGRWIENQKTVEVLVWGWVLVLGLIFLTIGMVIFKGTAYTFFNMLGAVTFVFILMIAVHGIKTYEVDKKFLKLVREWDSK